MSPILLLCMLLAASAAALAIDALLRRSRAARVSALAADWRMRYTADDRFQLAPKVTGRLPTPGAADVVVRDVLYAQEASGCFRYLFTVEYTTGVLRTKRRRTGVGMVLEGPACAAAPMDAYSSVTMAPAELALAEQYGWLRQSYAQEGADGGR
ncbi:MAG TPA: hypothetical protein VH475_10725 [Tepidisphaeraceae bacterium]